MNDGSGLQIATDEDERKRLWKARHEMIYSCTALVPGSKVTNSIITYMIWGEILKISPQIPASKVFLI